MARQAISAELKKQIINVRDVTPFTIYDSIVIGAGAKSLDPGWFDTFQEFSQANGAINLFAGRQGSVGQAYTNMRDPRRDWAMNLQLMHAEFFTTGPGLADFCSSPFDAQYLPRVWCEQLPKQLTFQLGLGDQADLMLQLPFNHVPAGYGSYGGQMDGSAGPAISEIVNGSPSVGNFYAWPPNAKLEIPAGNKIDLSLNLSDPLKGLLSNTAFPAPGSTVVANGEAEATKPIYYVLRVSFVATRALQQRGARSAA